MKELLVTKVKHMANIGDLIASLASIKSLYQKTGKKVFYFQQLDVKADYYSGAVHPTKDANGEQVMCNSKMLEMIKPLLLAQEYIFDVEAYTGQAINIDLDVIRQQIFVNLPNGALQSWLMLAYWDLAYDLSTSWIDVPEVDISTCRLSYPNLVTETMPLDLNNLKNMAIVNFTERYRNAHLQYFFLENYQNNLIFSGTEDEYNIFCSRWNLNIPRLIVVDFLQLAAILKKTKFMIGCQSFCWNLAESLKTPRILELCQYATNCQPFYGKDSYGYYHQPAIKYYVDFMFKK